MLNPLDPDDLALIASLVERTIIKAEWLDASAGEEIWANDNEIALLSLDDERVIQFGGYGYDDWGATVDEVTPEEEG